MQIQITGLDNLKAKLDRISQKTIRLATAAAIKDTAFQVRTGLQDEMKRAFDRPTPWVIRTVRVDITEVKEKQVAYVGLDFEGGNTESKWEAPAFAQHQIHGGTRKIKPSERQLRAAGILPPGMFIAPARDTWLDRYGNIPGPQMVQILSSVKSFENWAGAMMNKTATSRSKTKNKYFVMRRAGIPLGIWERRGPGNVAPVLIFIKEPHYKRRFNFHIVAQNVVFKNWKKNFKDRLKEYINYKL